MKTLVYNIQGFDKPFLTKAAVGKHELAFTEQLLNETTALLAKGFQVVSLFTSDNASAEVLAKLNECGVKYIALRSAGCDHVDLAEAKSLGIKVANVPDYSPYAIAEHTVAILLALNRKIVLGQQLIRQNDFRLNELVGFDLHGKTVGIVGTGKIGSAFAKIMYGFGCKLLAYDIEVNEALIKETQIEYVSFEKVCSQSDVISINCPLTADTKYMFDKSTFSTMKKGVVFINTSRGGIVSTKDLMEALDNGTVSFAGLDVYENEKPIFFKHHYDKKIEDELFEKLRAYPNVLITGHQAFLTNEALEGIAATTINNIDQWSKEGRSINDIY
jgi:D-lactate dehydrogenase